MCLILVVWRAHPDYPCVIAANRDEFHDRRSSPALWWPDHPQILAGRDLAAGGTWLGVTREGRFAALTNFRGTTPVDPRAPSRGALVRDFLIADDAVAARLAHDAAIADRFNGFNLLLSDGTCLGILESPRRSTRLLEPGLYGLSNHVLDAPWPKVLRAKSRMEAALGRLPDVDPILDLLRDDTPAPDAQLPRTGLSLEWERLLSSAFIRGADYGTRCSTVIRIDAGGGVVFDEWTWDRDGNEAGRVSERFQLQAARPRSTRS